MTMELEFERDTIVCYETLTEVTLCQEETLESIVPDACPDILRIVDVCGQATLSSKAAKEGMAVVTGMVRAVILYQPEGSAGLRRMEVGLPFTCQAEAPGLTDQGYVEASPRLRCAEARALNPRKVLLRVDLAVDVTALQPTEIPICSGASDTEDHTLCQRQYQGENYQISSVQEKPFTFTEQIRLQGNQGEIPQLLASRASAVCSENKLIGTKLILKGVVELELLLLEAGGGGVRVSRDRRGLDHVHVHGCYSDGPVCPPDYSSPVPPELFRGQSVQLPLFHLRRSICHPLRRRRGGTVYRRIPLPDYGVHLCACGSWRQTWGGTVQQRR